MIRLAIPALRAATESSLAGLRAGAASERAIRQELVLLALAIPLAPAVADDRWTGVALVGVLLAVLAVEFLNTAVEKLCDHLHPDHHPAIGRVKDLGSAAVLCTLLLASLVWGTALLGAAQRWLA